MLTVTDDEFDALVGQAMDGVPTELSHHMNNVAVFQGDYDPRIRQTGGVSQCDAPTNLNPVPYRLGGGNCPADHVGRREVKRMRAQRRLCQW